MITNSLRILTSRRQFGKSMGTIVAGAYLSPSVLQGVAGGRLKGLSRDGAILINSNENPYGPSARAIAAITGSEGVACRYPDDLYARALETMAELNHVQPENVALGCGSTEILRVCDAAFVGTDKKLVVAEPTFEAVTYYATVCRASTVKVPLTADFRHDLPAMARACDGGTGLVYVCNPNNPTGTINTRAEFTEFISKVPTTTYVLVDEAYFHFVEKPAYTSVIDMISEHPNLIVTRTFSKVYGMAGMRLGYAIAQKQTIEAMHRELLFDNGNAAVLAAAVASVQDPDVVPMNKKRLNDNRKWVTGELEKSGYKVIPSEANFFMVDTGADVAPVVQAFRERKIMVGRKFPSMGNWLRVSVGKPEEMQKFLAAFREIVPARKAAA
ncbi:MAG TPA: histidinol-phosphate transaminase [Candidatus Acidoferrales bacterium]|nr:histidinol-phosphate transaminase [Candidatus Acidoferrales bacterium]